MHAEIMDPLWIGNVQLPENIFAVHKTDAAKLPPPWDPGAESDSYLEPLSTAAKNSRIAVTLPSGRWKVERPRKYDHPEDEIVLLKHGNRLLMCTPGIWRLLDSTGEFLASGSIGSSEVTLDPENGLFYAVDGLGYLAARKLSDASLVFQAPIAFGNRFSYPLVARRGSSMLMVSIALPLTPDGPVPSRSAVDLLDLGAPPEVREDGILQSFKTQKRLNRMSTAVHSAMTDGSLVLADTHWLYLLSPTLEFWKAIRGDFTPRSLSLDEDGRIYMTVLTGEGSGALWVLTAEGELLVDTPLTDPTGATPRPPLVGFAHQIYLFNGDTIEAFDSDGRPAWTCAVGGHIAGGVVTRDDRLLVAAGNLLEVFDGDGERTVLYHFPDETLVSQPLVTREGRIIVATEQALCILVSEKE